MTSWVDVEVVEGAEGYFPAQGSEQAAAYDLHALAPKGQPYGSDIFLYGGDPPTVVRTGFKMALPRNLCALLLERSSTPNLRIELGNGVGLVDSDYRGEVYLSLQNENSTGLVTIKSGTRLAQMLIIERPDVVLRRVDNLDETARGEGGFGSTGMQQIQAGG